MTGRKLIALMAIAVTSVPVAAQTGTVTVAAQPDAATLDTARRVAARLLPPGVYKQIMSSSMDAVVANVGDALKAAPLSQLARIGGMKPEDARALDKIDVERIMTIYDPYWKERQQLSMRAMLAAMGDFFTTMEPDLREALARAYANRFSPSELSDLDRYFATPTGAKFAANSTTIMSDPAMRQTMQAIMPRMMAQMPKFIEAAQKATAALPPPRKLNDLSAPEKAQLAEAMGVDPSKLQDPKPGS